jgi:colanic acid biosynthesis glycosyl transferase WcaI
MKVSMSARKKLVIVSEYYSPDPSTTSEIMTAIATHLARDVPVLVLSGTAGSSATAESGRPTVVEIKKRATAKGALVKRALAETMFALRAFFRLLRTLSAGDVVLTVTAPFMLPYAVAAATWLRRGRSILIMHDFYPDVLVLTGLIKPSSLPSLVIHALNATMFRMLSAVVVIGRETEPLLLRYKGVTPDKIHLIPNWATLAAGVRPIRRENRFRQACSHGFVVGLSGNLGFTHDPDVVFEAARLLKDEQQIQFLLSGWGIGYARLHQLQAATPLVNVTLADRVPARELEELLAAANVWIIPYRADMVGVSVPSRLYNLLAVGRPILLVSDAKSDAAQLVNAHDIGWVIPPRDAAKLAVAIRQACAASDDAAMRERAVAVAREFTIDAALKGYDAVVRQLLQMSPSNPEQPQ